MADEPKAKAPAAGGDRPPLEVVNMFVDSASDDGLDDSASDDGERASLVLATHGAASF